MDKLEIGTKVKLNSSGATGTVTSADHLSYQIEHTDANGHLVRRSFIEEEFTVVADDAGDAGDGSGAGVDVTGNAAKSEAGTASDGGTAGEAGNGAANATAASTSGTQESGAAENAAGISSSSDAEKGTNDGEAEKQVADQNAEAAKADLAETEKQGEDA